MNVKRFTARTSREAMQKVRQAFGDEAVVLSNKPCPEGVEILAMPPEGIEAIERMDTGRPAPAAPSRLAQAARAPAARSPAAPARHLPDPDVQADVGELAMSTLSFQDYVRERMLKKREEAMKVRAERAREALLQNPVPATGSAIEARLAQRQRIASQGVVSALVEPVLEAPPQAHAPAPVPVPARAAMEAAPPRRPPPMLHDELRAAPAVPTLAEDKAARQERSEMMNELRSMKGLIEERFGAL
ncbi:MAG TPA: flagellar biosynthesis protein FlhF, partial [Burkholderiaceae bacterium]|nr:flagellar biosynthesis protein FlhF [Burkholderiaceae bacterium]